MSNKLQEDVFEDEEGEELKGHFEASADIGRSPLDLPSDFEDEEIDEDEAFGEEDDIRFGDMKTMKIGAKQKTLEVSLSEESDSDEAGGTLLSEFMKGEANVDGDADTEDAERYDKMMSAVLETKEKKRPRREELPVDPFLEESEYHVRPKGETQLTLQALMGNLQDNVGYGDLKKKLEQLETGKGALPAPLPQVVQDEIKRSVAYDTVKADVTSKWQTTVIANRRAEHLSFPFNQPQTPALSVSSMSETLKPKTDLEKGILDILQVSGIEEKKIAEWAEELPTKAMDPREVREREIQMRKMRNLLFYHELKMKRRAKIKSKAYHKILKKEKERKRISLGELQQIDEEAARREQEKLERMRIKERATQRHRNKGNWAKGQLKHALATESKQAISEQLKTRDQLLKKQNYMAGEEDSADELEALEQELEALDAEQAPEFPEQGLMSMEFMKRGMKKSEALMKAKEDEDDRRLLEAAGWAPEEEDERSATRELTEEEKKEKLLALTKGKAKKAISKIELSHSNQLEMVGLSAGRRITASAPLTVNFERKKDREAENVLFEVAPFPDVQEEEASSGPTHNINRNTEGVTKLVAQEGEKTSLKRKSIARPEDKAGAQEVPLVNGGEQNQEHLRIQKTKKRKTEEPDIAEVTMRLPLKSIAGLLKTSKQLYAAKDKIENVHDDVDNEDKIPLAVQSEKYVPTKVVDDKDNPWMKQADSAKEIRKSTKQKSSTSRLDKQHLKVHESSQDKSEREVRVKLEQAISAVDLDNLTKKQHFDLMRLGSDEQKEYVRRAFANDDVMADFKKEKEAAETENEPKPEPMLLGWGSWAGEGVKPRPQRQKPRLQEPIRKGPPRQDKALKHVIINEKRDKKAAKYQAPAVPVPFKKAEQYENSMRNPLGKLWNTQTVYEKLIEPRVRTKAGLMIAPIEKPLPKEHKEVKKWLKPHATKEGKAGKSRRGKKGKRNASAMDK